MKKNIVIAGLLLTSITALVSLNALAAPPAPAPTDNTATPALMQGPEHGRPPMPFMPHRPGDRGEHGGFCHGGELFCASMASDNPTDTLSKLNSIVPPASNGVHYEVRVSIVAVEDHAPHNGANDRSGQPEPGAH